MSDIRSIDIRFLDEVFEMESGYVLDFSDRTLRNFFADELDVDIDDRSYTKDGTSKAKRLRCYLRTIDNINAAKALRVLWEHRLALRERNGVEGDRSTIPGRFLQLLDKLEGRSQSTAPTAPTPCPAFGTRKFHDFKERLVALNSLEPHPRGYAFEKFLQDLFNAFGLSAREPFRLKGEQIDGSFILGSETYLVEAKWHNSPSGAEPLHGFHGKLEQKAAWARGVFISYSGFTTEGLHAFGRAKRVICVNGLDLHEAFNREITLNHLLESKVRRAAENGEPFTSIDSLFS